MTTRLYLPLDEFSGQRTNTNLAADFLELSALSSADHMALTSELATEASIGAEEDHASLDDELIHGEELLVTSAVNELVTRQRVLGAVYPFRIDATGDLLTFEPDAESLGHAAYILCLLLSNLQSSSGILAGSRLCPDRAEVDRLRKYFQYFATAALAAEINGTAWSFGFPRPDGSGFIQKLTQIWNCLDDGQVGRQTGAPSQPKDDQIDVFAARPHRDRLPGFLLAAAQVATGQDMRAKSLKGHLSAFKKRWFLTQPETEFIIYMIVPFAISDDQFIDDVRTLGNILHRLRVPLRVSEAERLVKTGAKIEGFDRLNGAAKWLAAYQLRVVT